MSVKKLGELLVETGLISENDLESALTESKQQHGVRIGCIIVQKGYATELDIAQTLSFQLNLPFIDISSFPIDHGVIRLVNEKLAQKYQLIPLSREHNILKIAMAAHWILPLSMMSDFQPGCSYSPCLYSIRYNCSYSYLLQYNKTHFCTP